MDLPPLPPDDSVIDPILLAQSAAALASQGASNEPQKQENAVWTCRNETTLLDYLLEVMSKSGDGLNFKEATWKASAHRVNSDSREKGGPKTWQSCKSKFQKLKALFLVICEIMGNSGWTWSDEKGACIDAASSGTWDAFVKRNKAAKPLRNAGWTHLKTFRQLMPDAAPKGSHVFRPRTALAQVTLPESQHESQPPSQPNEDEDDDGRSQTWSIEEKDSDNEQEKEKENEPVPPPSSAPKTPASGSRKRKPADSNAGTVKKPRLSGGAAALSGLSDHMGQFNKLMELALVPPTPAANPVDIAPSPVRLKNAVKRARELETWMEKVDLAVDIYDTFEDGDEELRIIWVKRKVGIEA
ncbi:Myb-DNA-bind-3 domain-containing protein [Favolaschia claudopus]|uniref:Myb-DNA-bind-3 domain-containing protein n=1 Tax=Favolaschia claudopus TaxID=2862362 RepID=A0AAV9ZI34_9AGAR